MKQTGLGDSLQVDDSSGTLRDISNDITNYSINLPQNLLDVTGIDKSAFEKLGALRDGSVSINGVFNPTANKSHDVFKVLTSVRTVTVSIGGATTGNPRISLEVLFASYNLSRGNDGSLTWTAEGQLADGTVPTWGTVA